MATEKQVRYIMFLLSKAGYGTKWMNAEFKTLGATCKERSGRVESWVSNLTQGEVNDVIKKLKEQIG